MNLYLYDEKYDIVIDYVPLPDEVLTDGKACVTADAFIQLLARNNITNRYKSLRIAKGYTRVYDDEYDEYRTKFKS